MARSFVQLSLDERRIIAQMHENKISQAEIARTLRRRLCRGSKPRNECGCIGPQLTQHCRLLVESTAERPSSGVLNAD